MQQTIHELKNDLAAAIARGETIIDLAEQESRDPTFSEQRIYDSAIAEAEGIKSQIEARAGNNSSQRIFAGQPSCDIFALGNMPAQSPIFSHSGIKLQAYKNTAKGREDAHTAGRFLAATFLRHGPSMKWCESNGVRYDVLAALGGGINTAGGALVPDEMSATIIELMETYGAFRQNADNIPMTSDSLTVPRRVGGLTAYYQGEASEATESDASWDNVQFIAKKLTVFTRMSSEISDDAVINLGDKMTQEIGIAFAFKEDSVGFNGAGISTDGGITGVLVKAIDAGHTLAKVAAASGHDTLAEVNSADVIKLMAALPTYAKKNAKFYCSPTALSLVFNTIQVAASGNTMQNLANAVQPSFLGYPIVVSPVFPDSASATYNGAVMIAFGDLQQAATLATRRDIRVALSDQRYFELDQIAIKGTLRHSIVAHDLGSTTVKSPFAVLVGTT